MRARELGVAGLVGLAAIDAAGWLLAHPSVGLDFQGGTSALVRGEGAAARVDRVLDRLGLDATVSATDDGVEVEVADATADDLQPLLDLAHPGRFGALVESSSGSVAFEAPLDRSSGPVRADPTPVLDGPDIASVGRVDAGSLGSGLRIDLTPDATARFAAWTADHVGERLVLALDGQALTAASLREPITRGAILLTLPGTSADDVEDLADRIATAGDPLQVEVDEVRSGWPRWLGVPLARVVAAMGLVAAVGVGVGVGRALVPVAVALVGLGLGMGAVGWIGGTFTLASWVGGAVALLGVGLVHPRTRIPAAIALGAAFVVAWVGCVVGHGFAYGVSVHAWAAALVGGGVGLVGWLADGR